ncbi:MAG: PAS domain-containing sensor histidine kinase, partial [Pseudomonadota bacterium]
KIGRLLSIGRGFLQTEAAFIERQNGADRELLFAEDAEGMLSVGQTLCGAPLPDPEASDDSVALSLADHLGRVCMWLGPGGESRPFAHGLGMRLRVNERDFGSLWFVTRHGETDALKEVDPAVLSELTQFVSYELGARDRLAAQLRAAREREQKQGELDMVLDNVPSRIWYKDGANNILFLNEEAARSMGMRREDVEGANTADLFPDMADQYLADDLAVIQSGEPRLGIVERYTPRNGPHGWVSTDKIPFVDKDTGEPRVLAVATDITPLMEAQKNLEEQAEQLKRSNHDLDQFAHVAAHDLRTPLRGMEHIVDWVQEDLETALGGSAPEDLTEKLDLLRGRVQRMGRMLTDMLTFARATHGSGSDIEEVADLDELLGEAASWISDARDIEVTVMPIGFGLRVAPTQLQQMLANLMTNAVRHHDRDAGFVRVEAERIDAGAVLHVVDDGPGIDEEYHDTVFDAFATLKRRDEVDSTGIGLAVVQRTMRSLGGAVRLTSPGKERGCRFSLEFPARLVGDVER